MRGHHGSHVRSHSLPSFQYRFKQGSMFSLVCEGDMQRLVVRGGGACLAFHRRILRNAITLRQGSETHVEFHTVGTTGEAIEYGRVRKAEVVISEGLAASRYYHDDRSARLTRKLSSSSLANGMRPVLQPGTSWFSISSAVATIAWSEGGKGEVGHICMVHKNVLLRRWSMV